MDIRIMVKRIVVGWIIILLLVALFGRVTVAETSGGSTAASFLLIGAGARAAGLGGAYTAVSEGATASYWNPSGLTTIDESEVLFSHFAWYQDMSLEYGAVAHRLSDVSTISASITYFNYGTIDGYDVDGNQTGEISAYDMAAAVSFGYRVNEKIALGATGKFVTQKLDDIGGSTVAMDLGATYVREHFTVAAMIGNIGPSMSFEGISERLPSLARIGFSAYPIEDRLLTSIELEQRYHGSTVLRHGAEFNFDEQYYLRAGYCYLPGADSRSFGTDISVGAGVRLAGADIDYAYTFREKYTAEDLHRFTVVFRFSP